MSKLRTANLLGALAGEVAWRLQQRLKRHPNQTDSAAAALNLISYYEGCPNGWLSRSLGLSHTATVRLVDKLEAEGLVERRPAADRRAVALHLAPAGRDRIRAVLVDRCATLARVTATLSPAEQDQLAGLMEKMLRGLTEDPDQANHLCRLCDEIACPGESCPVHQAALALAEA